nr:DUF1737 domain-containing protein [Yersinia aldovae]
MTGSDDASFCKRVSEQLQIGYVLYMVHRQSLMTQKKRSSSQHKRSFGRISKCQFSSNNSLLPG